MLSTHITNSLRDGKRNRGRILGRFTSPDSVGWGTAARMLDDMHVCIMSTGMSDNFSGHHPGWRP